MVQFFEVLRYKPQDGGFGSRLRHGDFFIDLMLSTALWNWIESASNRNEYGRGGGLKAEKLTPFTCRLSRNSGSLNLLVS
jgi:hypothetical protein